MDLTEFRQQYQMYDDMSDKDLAKGMHAKYYSDMPFESFWEKIKGGVSKAGEAIGAELHDVVQTTKEAAPRMADAAATLGSGFVVTPLAKASGVYNYAKAKLRGEKDPVGYAKAGEQESINMLGYKSRYPDTTNQAMELFGKHEPSSQIFSRGTELIEKHATNLLGEESGYLAGAAPILMGTFGGPKGKSWKTAKGKFTSMGDKIPRFEISDHAAKVHQTKLLEKPPHGPSGDYYSKSLPDVLHHPKLYENYPQLMDWDIQPINGDILQNTKASVNLRNKIIYVNADKFAKYTPLEVKKTLLHEVQHIIQSIEKTAHGGSPSLFEHEVVKEQVDFIKKNKPRIKEIYKTKQNLIKERNRLEKNLFKDWVEAVAGDETLQQGDLDKSMKYLKEISEQIENYNKELVRLTSPDTPSAVERYNNLAGEIESRDTAARSELTPEQRMKTGPYTSEDIPLEKWGYRFEAPEVSSVGKKTESLRPAVMHKGEKFEGKEGSTHPDIMKEHNIGPNEPHTRGFVTPNGHFMTRKQSEKWMEKFRPDEHKEWLKVVEGDENASLHSQDLNEAREGKVAGGGKGRVKGATIEGVGKGKYGWVKGQGFIKITKETEGIVSGTLIDKEGSPIEKKAEGGYSRTVVAAKPNEVVPAFMNMKYGELEKGAKAK